jgi:DDE superfamily endonuclease
MELYARVEQILTKLRPAFSRTASFEWFVLLLWGTMLATQSPAVSSYLNALGLGERYYHQALHWFRTSAFSIDDLCQRWGRWLSEQAYTHRLDGHRVYVGDGIKVAKEGRKMPGVKGLHQESSDVRKPEWIRGHYFSALGILMGAGKALFATPIMLKLHDGITVPLGDDDLEAMTLVDKMANLCVAVMSEGSYAILDAYYACAKVLTPFREHGLHLISRVRITTVAYAVFSRRPGAKGKGPERLWGSAIKLRDLFAPLKACEQAVWLYGRTTTVYYQCFKFHWDSPDEIVLFVLTQLPCGRRLILLSSNPSLTGTQVIEAYGWRFKIEVSFRTLVHLLGGFGYRFWLQSMDKLSQWPQNLVLADYDPQVQQQIAITIEAFERFVNLNAIALGLLQLLALEQPGWIWAHFPRWFRTVPKHGYPTEQIVRITLQHQHSFLEKSKPALLLTQILALKKQVPKDPGKPAFVASD